MLCCVFDGRRAGSKAFCCSCDGLNWLFADRRAGSKVSVSFSLVFLMAGARAPRLFVVCSPRAGFKVFLLYLMISAIPRAGFKAFCCMFDDFSNTSCGL